MYRLEWVTKNNRQSKVDQVSRHKVIVHYLSTAGVHCVDRFYGFYMTWTLIRLFFEEEPSLGFRIVNIIFNLGQQSSKLPFLDHFVLEALSLLLRTLQLHKVMRVGSVMFCDPSIWQKLRSYKVSHRLWLRKTIGLSPLFALICINVEPTMTQNCAPLLHIDIDND